MKKIFFTVGILMLMFGMTSQVCAQDVKEDVNDGKEAIVVMPEHSAEFPGGIGELMRYLRENVQYPARARDAGMHGTVLVEFVVEKDGSISHITVLNSVCEPLDEEAVRVVKAMPKWKPGDKDGQKCRTYFQLPITFELK